MAASPGTQSAPSSNVSPPNSSSASLVVPSTPTATTPISAASPASNAPTPVPSSTSAAISTTGPPHLAIRPAATGPSGTHRSAAPINMMAMSAVISPLPDREPLKMPASVTSKEWVIPPRPKPGRKPATDTPPTKRKAQNRAAQRAFRERRAARVGELEEQLEEHREEHEKVERELRAKVHGLEAETQNLRTRCQVLENMLERERQECGRVNGELEILRRKWGEDAHAVQQPRSVVVPSKGAGLAAIPGEQHLQHLQHPRTQVAQTDRQLPHKASRRDSTPGATSIAGSRPPTQAFSISQIISPPDELVTDGLTCGSCEPDGSCACADAALASAVVGCGKCTLGSRCECLEAELKAAGSGFGPGPDLKRPLRSPASFAPDEKRHRSDSAEADLTALFANRKRSSSASVRQGTPVPYVPAPPPQQQQQQLGVMQERDGCGFCGEGTYCVCADAAAAVAAMAPGGTAPSLALSQQAQMTPPPSEGDVGPMAMEVTASGAIKLPTARGVQYASASKGSAPGAATVNKPNPNTSSSSSGMSGPGTCAQCLSDPKSGLFCRSLAANFARTHRSAAGSGGCCGNAGPGGCCKSGSSTPNARRGGSLGLSLSCADAYKTLASHRHFDEAADDIGAWLPLLRAAPPDGDLSGPADTGAGSGPERLPIEVEAASIMSVLKGFDVRFGK